MLDIISTEDGSHSLINHQLDETYHSRHGAVQESVHVFIQHGLNYFLENHPTDTIRILEVGFGTGLNALLTLHKSQSKNQSIEYTSLEAFPVAEHLVMQLNYPELIALADGRGLFQKLHASPWNAIEKITSYFHLKKIEGRIQELGLPKNYFDIIFFDAFAPNKQPDMWELSVLSKVFDAMKSNAVFVTYCAKGQLKRDLKSLGLLVESLLGPPGKREMIRARKSTL